MTILKVLFWIQMSKKQTILSVSHILIPIEYRIRQHATAGDDGVHSRNVGIQSKLLNSTNAVNDNEQDSGKKSV